MDAHGTGTCSFETGTFGSGKVTRIGRGRPVGPSVPAEVAMPSLAGRDMAARFCAWRGGSDRRYVASVYPVDRRAADLGLPDFEGFVLIAVGRGAGGRNIHDVSAIERDSDRQAAIALGLASGADEWHVQLLAEDRRERAAMVADLIARHVPAETNRCA